MFYKYIGELLMESKCPMAHITKFSSGRQWPWLQWPPSQKEQPQFRNNFSINGQFRDRNGF